MSRSITVTDDLYSKASAVAARDRVSVEEFVSRVLADRLASREFFDARSARFNRSDFEQTLDTIPDVDPEPHDRF